MSYDQEKYRAKRDKVLGVRKRGPGFAATLAAVAGLIVLGLGGVGVPRALEYLATRNLDDAIYKRADSGAWSPEVVQAIRAQPGVSQAVVDHHTTRLVVTFNREEIDPSRLEALFNRQGLQVELLNRVDHRNRLTILGKEGKIASP